jgi:hypothetical protein
MIGSGRRAFHRSVNGASHAFLLILPSRPKGLIGLCRQDNDGYWVNAVDLNTGGIKHFLLGPWHSSYGLGTYGIDTKDQNGLGSRQFPG